ncbi:MAG: hypothetical protein AB8B56_00715 [Crocinitomicaceae bacterium]
MLRYLTPIIGIALLTACEEPEPITKDVIEVEGITAEIPDDDLFNYDTLQGMYVGDFGGSDIRIILNYVSRTNAVGYNIHKGLQRNLSGKVTRSGDSITVYMAEPGDHEFDGVFELLFIGEGAEPQGSWKSNSGLISEKEFKLERVQTKDGINWEKQEKINMVNLHNYFSESSDTLGEYSFKSDGLVIFSYYEGGYWGDESEDGTERNNKQMKQIQGTWSMDGQFVNVAWEPNKVLPKLNMRYELKQGDYEPELYWKDNPIYMNMYP